MFACLGLFAGSGWADAANSGMFGNNGVGFGEPTALGSFSRDDQVLGHSTLNRWPGLSASNWGGAPYYSDLGNRTVYAIPNQSGNGQAYPMNNWGHSGHAAFNALRTKRPWAS